MYEIKMRTTDSYEPHVTETISADIQMEFRISKHTANGIENGKTNAAIIFTVEEAVEVIFEFKYYEDTLKRQYLNILESEL
jgi:hypothetical protein